MTTPAGDAERLVSMHQALVRMLLVVRSSADEFGGDFAQDSPGRSDWELCPPGLGSHVRQAYQTGMVLWHSIQDHGYGLADAILSGRTYTAMTVARSLAEGAARSWYMLQDEVDHLERARRLINERLFADHENEWLFVGLLPSPGNPKATEVVAKAAECAIRSRIAEVQADQQSLLNDARGLSLLPIKQGTKTKVAYVGGYPRPTAMSLIGELLGAAPTGASFFRSTSSVAHTSLHGQVRMLTIAQRADGADLSRVRPMTPDDLAAQAWVAVAAVALAASILFRQAGWQTRALDEAVEDLTEVWNPPPSDDLLAQFGSLS